ncbi:MAG: hypothetical protein JRE65_14535 [Deltaproteobacteria bacterium]|jgi:hypothetical protein|nr:hypothetical protein [Deltaproteobacteria bacterium]
MLTIEQRRKADRKRRERWRKRKLAQGCKQIQLMLTPEAQAILEHEKLRTGEPYVQIIHRAIIEIDTGLPIISSKSKAQPIVSEMSKEQTNDSSKTKPRSKISSPKKAGQQDQLTLF